MPARVFRPFFDSRLAEYLLYPAIQYLPYIMR
jgi:hypothetical protein